MKAYNYLKAFLYFKKLLYNVEFASKEKIATYQFKQLQKVINNAWETVPFYKKYWLENGFNPSMFKSLEDYNKIPFIDKETIKII